MSLAVSLPTPEQLRDVAERCGLSLTDEDVVSFRGLMQGSVDAYNAVAACRYPRLKDKPLYDIGQATERVAAARSAYSACGWYREGVTMASKRSVSELEPLTIQ